MNSETPEQVQFFNAIKLAIQSHAGQKRKYTGVPYIYHLLDVAQILIENELNDTDLLTAAVLHDIIEDTEQTKESLSAKFNKNVVELVLEVTNVSKLSDGNRHTRKEIDRKHLINASISGKQIKLADICSNISGLSSLDPSFSKIYIPEKKKLIEDLKEGSLILYKKASLLIQNEEAIINGN